MMTVHDRLLPPLCQQCCQLCLGASYRIRGFADVLRKWKFHQAHLLDSAYTIMRALIITKLLGTHTDMSARQLTASRY